ncbi:MAG: AAC(3) family N-acetyltransferase [Oligosphaeraceae bacterium]|nr:AAC(3) family N-acetyltransferase [Oligosphaeraceae bacterium]
MHTYLSLTNDLAQSGLRPEDSVLVHSSMKAIGEVEGRADTVLDVLMDYFGRRGLLVFPTLTWSNVNAAQPRFSVRETASVVGILPQLFRQRPGVIRSLHPTHSVAACGADAGAFCAGHERFQSPCARQSPWGKLYDRKGKILFLGASIAHNTFLHAVEEWFDLDATVSLDTQQLEVCDEAGRVVSLPSRRHTGGHSQFYDLMEAPFLAAGALTRCRIGDAACCILDARAAADCTRRMLLENPQLFILEWNHDHPQFWAQIQNRRPE